MSHRHVVHLLKAISRYHSCYELYEETSQVSLFYFKKLIVNRTYAINKINSKLTVLL